MIGIESLGNLVFNDALSTSIAFDDDNIKEYSIWWEVSDLIDLNSKYKEIKLIVETDFGLLYEQNEPGNDILIYSYRAIDEEYVINLIGRKVEENKYFLKLSCIASANTELYKVGGKIQDNDISYIIPDGWIANVSENSVYKIIFGPRKNDYNPNITIAKFNEDRTLNEIFQSVCDELSDASINIIDKNSVFFTSDENGEIARIIYEYEQINVYQYYFRVGNRNEFFVLTCGELANDNNEYMDIFDKFVKSIRLK